MSFKDYYNQEVKKKMGQELKLKNVMEVPRVIKIVVNVGAGESVTNKNVLEKIQEHLTLITGQKSIITKARKSVSAFKIRKGLPIGVKVTLRDQKMFNFLEKLIKIVIENTTVIRIIARAILKAISPLDVSNAIDVVKTRVTYLMFPPSIIEAPSSANALLKEAITASEIPQKDSRITAKVV